MFDFENSSIRNKLIFIQLATAFLAVLICCVFFVYNDVRVFKEASVKTKYSIAEIIGINATPTLEFADKESAAKMLLMLRSNPTILNAVILDKDGKEFARYNKEGEEAFSFQSIDTKKENAKSTFGQRFLVSYKILSPEFMGTVILRSELSGFSEIVFSYIKIAALILIASLVVALIISTVLQRFITDRLLALVAKTKEISDTGNYSIRVPAKGNDEVSILTSSFNEMLRHIENMQGTLKGTNTELERRVKVRTQELENANKELERFVYVASHDLQEPLRTITNYTSLLQGKYSHTLDETGNKYLASTVRSAARMRTLIKDLLDLSRIGKDKTITSVDTAEIIKEVIAQLDASIKESNAIITFSGMPVIQANEIEMKQLFQNLISNALKFRKTGTVPHITVSAQTKTNEYLFAVQDNGIGIEPQFKDRIFIVFQRLHGKHEYPGTGIGLATCQKIVALHHGAIWVESSLGQGSTFYFTISRKL